MQARVGCVKRVGCDVACSCSAYKCVSILMMSCRNSKTQDSHGRVTPSPLPPQGLSIRNETSARMLSGRPSVLRPLNGGRVAGRGCFFGDMSSWLVGLGETMVWLG